MLSVSVDIQKPSKMVYKEGVLANNTIMGYEEFANLVRNQLEEYKGNIRSELESIQQKINSKKLKEAYQAWETFEEKFFLNGNYKVALLFIDNIDTDSGNITFQYNSSEQEIMGESGKLNQLQNFKRELFNASFASQVGEHLQGFINDVDTKHIPFLEYIMDEIFSDQHGRGMRQRASNARWHTKDWTYKNIIFGKNPSYRGNVADAFMNHFAGMHAQILGQTIEDELNIEDGKKLFALSVFEEEKENIWNLLINSTNNTPWFTGGDIIMKIGNQLYNIQLKTGLSKNLQTQRERIGGKLAVKALNSMINKILANLGNSENIINIFYKELQTSGYVELTEEILDNNLDNLLDILT